MAEEGQDREMKREREGRRERKSRKSPYTLHPIPYILNPTPRQPTPYNLTLTSTPYTLHCTSFFHTHCTTNDFSIEVPKKEKFKKEKL
jgi:hypothetical protein